MWTVYGIGSPGVGIKYVGCTRMEIGQRVMRHVHTARCGKRASATEWIREMIASNTPIVGYELARCESSAAGQQAESAAIAALVTSGVSLLNKAKAKPKNPHWRLPDMHYFLWSGGEISNGGGNPPPVFPETDLDESDALLAEVDSPDR